MSGNTAIRSVSAALEPEPHSVRNYALADFLRKFATVIVVCLALAIMAHVLVAIVEASS